jgi:hypothetical protein
MERSNNIFIIMNRILLLQIVLFMLLSGAGYSQESPVEKGLQAITMNTIKAQLGFLASDWTEGREAGEKGEYMAGDYIASMLQLYGVKPAGDLPRFSRGIATPEAMNERTYFQNFILIKTSPGEEQILKVMSSEGKTVKTTDFSYNVDFAVRPVSPSVETEAPVVFAGYGFVSSKLKYNDYNKLDIKGKFILKISGTPKAASSLSASELSDASKEAETTLKSLGAAGIIEVNPSSVVAGNPKRKEFLVMSPSEGSPSSGRPYASYSIPGKLNSDAIPRISVSVKTANEILKGTGLDIDGYIKQSDSGAGQSLPAMSEKSIYLKTTVVNTQLAVRNIVGVIEGNNPDQVIVLGAHYDHLGVGNGYLWNGADDNGSGTVGIMTIAKAISQTGKKPEKTILIALWTAEEEGLLGSRYWVQYPTYPLSNIKLNLNFDMISRYINEDEKKKATMTYTDKFLWFKDMTASNLKKYGIDLVVDYQPSADPPGGSDHRTFTAAGIPVMRFKPGHREEYHTPADELRTVDWDIMEKIIKIGYLNIWELANREW